MRIELDDLTRPAVHALLAEHPAFTPAHRLYQSAGFEVCGPFAGYLEDPHSLFMSLRLAAPAAR